MAEVKIKGLIATTELKVGETATVERTEHIQGLIDRGFVREYTEDTSGNVEEAVEKPKRTSGRAKAKDDAADGETGTTE